MVIVVVQIGWQCSLPRYKLFIHWFSIVYSQRLICWLIHFIFIHSLIHLFIYSYRNRLINSYTFAHLFALIYSLIIYRSFLHWFFVFEFVCFSFILYSLSIHCFTSIHLLSIQLIYLQMCVSMSHSAGVWETFKATGRQPPYKSLLLYLTRLYNVFMYVQRLSNWFCVWCLEPWMHRLPPVWRSIFRFKVLNDGWSTSS